MRELTDEVKDILKKWMRESAKKGNLANSGVVLEDGKVIATAESWVASDCNATAHSERMLVEMVCQLKHSQWTPGLTMISVVEPCVMCIGACALAGYKDLRYIIPAKRYAKKISYLTNDTRVDKVALAKQFDQPIELVHLVKYEDEFAKIFEESMEWILKKK